jgi:hypothetical protein
MKRQLRISADVGHNAKIMKDRDKHINWFILIGGLLLMYIIFPILIASIPLIIIVSAYFIWKKSKLIWPFIFLQPFIIISLIVGISAIKDYSDGKGYLKSYGGGLLGLSEVSLLVDSTYRVPFYPTDITTNYDPYIFIPQNISTKMMVKIFGYQTGSYTGEWPSRILAKDYLKNYSTTIPFLRNSNELIFTINKQERALIDFFEQSEKADSLNIAKFNESDCFLISSDGIDSLSTIVLYDLANSKTLAIYKF